MIDFDDLLLLPCVLLNLFPNFKVKVSKEYKYIFVDEFQDINFLQNKLITFLSSYHNNICVVGDNNQSIYSFRGSDNKYIKEFKKQKNLKTDILENNYRSTYSILHYSNKLLPENNKNITCTRSFDDFVTVYSSDNSKKEAVKIVGDIKKLIDDNCDLSDIAIIYRMHSLKYDIKVELEKENIPFHIFNSENKIKDKDNLNSISLMTAHTSKGLEFKNVFVIGCEDGVFPLLRDNIKIDEERRLFYVAITRAKDKLTLSYSRNKLNIKDCGYKLLEPSRFLQEMGFLEEQNKYNKKDKIIFKEKDIVIHRNFGAGLVEKVHLSNKENDDKDYKLTINFGEFTFDILSSFVCRSDLANKNPSSNTEYSDYHRKRYTAQTLFTLETDKNLTPKMRGFLESQIKN
jgi:superfamily I DNA/RNA helicase